MVKEKRPCPVAGAEPCSSACPVCHGRGTVRPWTMVVEVDIAPGEARQCLDELRGLPVGLSIGGCRSNHSRVAVVVSVLRYNLSEAMVIACGHFASSTGGAPLVRKAW
jgi:hypothetical protein